MVKHSTDDGKRRHAASSSSRVKNPLELVPAGTAFSIVNGASPRGATSAPAGPEARSAGGVAGALGKSRTILPDTPPASTPESRQARAERMELREQLRQVTTVKRLSGCGRKARTGRVSLKHSEATNTAGFGNLTTCGSVWLCPVCASKIASVRSEELSRLFVAASAQRKRLMMVTLTMKHARAEALADVLGDLSAAWGALVSGRAWVASHTAVGMVGWMKALEVTHGRNGWHPHFHVMFVLDDCSDQEASLFGHEVGARWLDKLSEVGRTATVKHGYRVDVHERTNDPAKLARYVSKLSKEATMGAAKHGRNGSRSPMQVAASGLASFRAASVARLHASGDMEVADLMQQNKDLALWREWEAVMPGKRAHTWSKGLNEYARALGIKVLESDQEAAEQEHGGELVCELPSHTWVAIRRHASQWLDLCETQGPAAVLAKLRSLDLVYFTPEDLAEDEDQADDVDQQLPADWPTVPSLADDAALFASVRAAKLAIALRGGPVAAWGAR